MLFSYSEIYFDFCQNSYWQHSAVSTALSVWTVSTRWKYLYIRRFAHCWQTATTPILTEFWCSQLNFDLFSLHVQKFFNWNKTPTLSRWCYLIIYDKLSNYRLCPAFLIDHFTFINNRLLQFDLFHMLIRFSHLVGSRAPFILFPFAQCWI